MPVPAAAVASALPFVEKGISQVSKILDDRIVEHRIIRRRKNRETTTTIGLNGWHVLGAGALVLAGFAIGAIGWREHEYKYYDDKTKTVKTGKINLPCAFKGGNDRLGVRIGFNPITGILPIPVFVP